MLPHEQIWIVTASLSNAFGHFVASVKQAIIV